MSEIESINDLNADLFSVEEVDRFSDPKEARKKAMDYLARREYGQRELEQKLIAAGFEAVTARARTSCSRESTRARDPSASVRNSANAVSMTA
jgi:SOS response regulatory protein OraA/RecX